MAPKKECPEKCPEKRGRGRPRTFDREKALYAAMALFWERGYEASSFDDLIAAMGVSASSFYNSFGCKETLYLEAIERYARDAAIWFMEALASSPDTRVAFANLLEAGARAFTAASNPAGCMIVAAVAQCTPSHDRLRDMLDTLREATHHAMIARLQQGIDLGDLAPDTDIETLAAFYTTLLRGMSLQARDGVGQDQLVMIGRVADAPWTGRSVQKRPAQKGPAFKGEL